MFLIHFIYANDSINFHYSVKDYEADQFEERRDFKKKLKKW